MSKDTVIYCAHEYTKDNLRFAATVEPENVNIKQRITDVNVMRRQGRPTIPFSLDLELATNPFLRCKYHRVIQTVQKFAKRGLITPQEVFVVLRKWKDQF